MFLGGVSGSGKTTLAAGIKQLYGEDCYNFDFVHIYQRLKGQVRPDYQIPNWEEHMRSSISNGLKQGYELIIANSRFVDRSRRDAAFNFVSGKATALPLILRPPILTAYHRIKSGRPTPEDHYTHRGNCREQLIDLCKKSIYDDQSDILLPSDKESIPGEYMAILRRSDLNKPLVNQNGCDLRVKWVSTSQELTPALCVDLVRSGIRDPYAIRSYIEGNIMRKEIEYSGNPGVESVYSWNPGKERNGY